MEGGIGEAVNGGRYWGRGIVPVMMYSALGY